jgi:hypothetical protein
MECIQSSQKLHRHSSILHSFGFNQRGNGLRGIPLANSLFDERQHGIAPETRFDYLLQRWCSVSRPLYPSKL